jgi:hypothetical protein
MIFKKSEQKKEPRWGRGSDIKLSGDVSEILLQHHHISNKALSFSAACNRPSPLWNSSVRTGNRKRILS